MTDNPSPAFGGSLIVAGVASNTGKTTITLAALRAMVRQGLRVSSGKAGPDYIDPAYHRAASGTPCMNLDSFAMSADTLGRIAGILTNGFDFTLIEGVMGLFDGSAGGTGSTADVAGRLGLPVLLVLDVSGQSTSAGAIAHGFKTFDEKARIVGAVLNRVASPRHGELCRAAVEDAGIPVVSILPENLSIVRERRHLGLRQADEDPDLERFMESAADWFEEGTDWPAFTGLFETLSVETPGVSNKQSAGGWGLIPPSGHIAVASDLAFSFIYPHLLAAWKEGGARVSFFSPLAGEAPTPSADFIYLPGGYPELHAEALGRQRDFFGGLRRAAGSGIPIYGECGGYMTLGRTLTDASGQTHQMAGLLPVDFAIDRPKRRLGYRRAVLQGPALGEPADAPFYAHEFHYASAVHAEPYSENLKPLFEIEDATGEKLGPAGHLKGSVAGSFVHIIDRAAD